MRSVGFKEGFVHSCKNVLEEATLPMHILNLLIISTYPVTWLGVWLYCRVRG